MSKLTHFDEAGKAHMVDVGDKPPTRRVAIAEGEIHMQPKTLALILEGGHKKGDVLGVARLAGIMAAKKTAELVPLCHPLALCHVALDLIWLDADFNVVHVEHERPPCPTEGDCPAVAPMRLSHYVLEIAGGIAAEQKLSVGDRLIILSEPSIR